MRKKRSWKDHAEMLSYLMDHSVKQTAQHYKVSESALNGWLYRLRKQLTEIQSALNVIRNLQKISPRIRKYTLDGSLKEDEF